MTGRKAPCSDANWVHWTVHDTIQARLDSVSSATSAFAQFSPCSLACVLCGARAAFSSHATLTHRCLIKSAPESEYQHQVCSS